MKTNLNQPVLGVIYCNRDFFPDQLVTEARADMAKVFAKFGIKAIQLGESDSKLGGVETHNDARKCAELFKKHAGEIDGVLVVLPNFGDEKGVADTLKMSKLNVPVLIQGYPDDLKQDFRHEQSCADGHQVLAHEQARLPSNLGQLRD